VIARCSPWCGRDRDLGIYADFHFGGSYALQMYSHVPLAGVSLIDPNAFQKWVFC
jgi:hypothetical protein